MANSCFQASGALSVTYGDDIRAETIRFSDSANDPIDITGWTAELQVAVNTDLNNGTPSFTIAGIITDAINGLMSFTFTKTETTLLDPGQYNYMIIVKKDTNEIVKIIKSTYEVCNVFQEVL